VVYEDDSVIEIRKDFYRKKIEIENGYGYEMK